MKKEQNFVRIIYNEKQDSFDLEISTDGGKSWGLSMSAHCIHSKRNNEADEKEFIHYSIISELNKAIWIGYKYWPYGVNNAEG